MNDLEELSARAEALATEGRWRDAAHCFADLATRCERGGYAPGAAWAWDAAGEAWRRDDQPIAATRALRLALEHAEKPALTLVKLASVRVDVGDLAEAEDLCRLVLNERPAAGIAAIARDTLAGVMLARGDKEPARGLVARAARTRPEEAARSFRRAQVARLDGAFDAALAHLRKVEDLLSEQPGAEAGVAAADAERAEILSLRGDHAEALDALERASRGQDAAGRTSLRYRAVAARVRTMVLAGLDALGFELEGGLELARRQGLVPLEVDLCIARGMARASRDPAGASRDFRHATDLAEQCQLPVHAGRARLEWSTRIPGAVAPRRRLLEHALGCLAVNAPLHARAELAMADWVEDPERADVLRKRAHAQLGAMGMPVDPCPGRAGAA